MERHEIKQAVKLSQPDMEKEREKYLDEIAKFKDMVRDCDVDKTDSNGEITNEEGLQCLQQFVSFHMIISKKRLKQDVFATKRFLTFSKKKSIVNM